MLNNVPKHVAIIMDGNGRWAKLQNRPRTFGHKQGVEVIKEILESAIDHEISTLSLFTFSTENWNRSKKEINFIMNLVIKKLNKQTLTYFNKHQIQFRWTGFSEQLSKTIVEKLLLIQTATQHHKKIILNICLNYGGQQDILQAAQRMQKSKLDFNDLLLTKGLSQIDLLIRTGNEKRLSNFMLWQLAYAEIIFEHTFWPDYNSKIFTKNLLEFSGRKRRFGRA